MLGTLVFLLSACAGGSKTSAEITMTMNEFSYSPSSIKVSAGQPVELTITNDGQVEGHEAAGMVGELVVVSE